jgi:hypothetical protein
MFPEVLTVLLGRVPALEPASAPGWRAAALRDRIYPGLVRPGPPGGAAGETVFAAVATGRVLLGLDAGERAVLDAFEGAAYEAGPLVLADGRAALAYHWLDPAAVTDQDWDAGAFAEEHLARYARRCATWRARMSDPVPEPRADPRSAGRGGR